MQGSCDKLDESLQHLSATWQPGQCVLQLDAAAFIIDKPNNIWLHSLYFVAARQNVQRPFYIIPLICSRDGAQVRVTGSTFMGDGGFMRGAGVEIGCRAYFAGVAVQPPYSKRPGTCQLLFRSGPK